METHCRLCGVAKTDGQSRCPCGYVYSPPPKPGLFHADDLELEHDGLPQIRTNSPFILLMLFVMSGINGAGLCVFLMAFMVATLAGLAFRLGAWLPLLAFGVSAIALDLLSRRLLGSSIFDIRKGTEFLHVPVWVVGIVGVFAGLVAIAVQYS